MMIEVKTSSGVFESAVQKAAEHGKVREERREEPN